MDGRWRGEAKKSSRQDSQAGRHYWAQARNSNILSDSSQSVTIDRSCSRLQCLPGSLPRLHSLVLFRHSSTHQTLLSPPQDLCHIKVGELSVGGPGTTGLGCRRRCHRHRCHSDAPFLPTGRPLSAPSCQHSRAAARTTTTARRRTAAAHGRCTSTSTSRGSVGTAAAACPLGHGCCSSCLQLSSAALQLLHCSELAQHGTLAPVQVRCLNEAVGGSCKKVFKPWHQRLDAAPTSSSGGGGGGQLGAATGGEM